MKLLDIFGDTISKCPDIIRKNTPLLAHSLDSSRSIELKLLVNHYESPCMMPKLAPKILKQLTSILEKTNSYVKSFKCAYECISKDEELRIILIGDKKKVPEGKHPGIIIINVNDFFLASYSD